MVDFVGPSVILEGWSKGYVDFVWDPHLRTVTPWVSAEGQNWSAAPKLETSVWAAEFKAYDGQHAQPGDHDACSLAVSQFDEGNGILLVRASFSCGGGCGGPWYTSRDAIWTSPDALKWSNLDIPRTFGAGGIGSISGGSSGFIALSAAGATRTLWLSSNGRTWTNGTLPADLRKSTSSASDPAAIAGGYVLPGVVLVRTGDQGLGGGAGCVAAEGPINPPVYRGGLWWSTDGRSWIRDNLDGAVDAAYVTMAVTRIDDHTLVAVENGYTPNVRGVIATEWASLDGKAWTLLKGASPYATAITDGTRGLLRDCSPTTDTTVNNWPSLCAIGPGLDLVVLTQRGEQPKVGFAQMALGPAGALATEDGSRFWIGVPTAG